MSPTKQKYRFAMLIVLAIALVLSLYPQTDVLASSLNQPVSYVLEKQAGKNQCTFAKFIPRFKNEKIITRNGFHIDLYGTGELDFSKEGHLKYATLSLAPDLSGNYSASRITEVDTTLPPEERTKCWQPTKKWDVVVAYIVRFEQAENPGLTENLVLWNAPIGVDGSLPFTVVGATRNQMFPGYLAMIAQDLVIGAEPSGFIQLAPMPEWLDPTEWHFVQIRVSQQHASVAVAQALFGFENLNYKNMDNGRENLNYEVVLDVDLPAPVEPLAFEFSLDNEVLPGLVIPFAEQDSLDVASLGIWYEKKH
jgi:hypothetical protein